jgi:hypothetical protein
MVEYCFLLWYTNPVHRFYGQHYLQRASSKPQQLLLVDLQHSLHRGADPVRTDAAIDVCDTVGVQYLDELRVHLLLMEPEQSVFIPRRRSQRGERTKSAPRCDTLDGCDGRLRQGAQQRRPMFAVGVCRGAE